MTSDDDDLHESDDSTPAAKRTPEGAGGPTDAAEQRRLVARRHFTFGWGGLAVFAGLGLVLEALIGFRVDAYVNVANETRRHMFTLGHAHGTLLSLVNLAFALTLASPLGDRLRKFKTPSTCLLAASILVPAGFFAGGLVIYEGDPGLGIMLVPVGAVLLVVGAAMVARR